MLLRKRIMSIQYLIMEPAAPYKLIIKERQFTKLHAGGIRLEIIDQNKFRLILNGIQQLNDQRQLNTQEICENIIRSNQFSMQKRQKLINRVIDQQVSVVKASKKLGIKISTAKLILKKYKQTGAIFQKKMPNYKRKSLKETPSGPQDSKKVEIQINVSQITSTQKKLQVDEQNRKSLEFPTTTGFYWYWPIFYY